MEDEEKSGTFEPKDVALYKKGLNRTEVNRWVFTANRVLENSGDRHVAINLANRKIGKQRRKG